MISTRGRHCLQLVGVDENDPRRPLFRGRNDFMRRWAANETSGRTSILDMDYLSLAPDAPTGLLGMAFARLLLELI